MRLTGHPISQLDLFAEHVHSVPYTHQRLRVPCAGHNQVNQTPLTFIPAGGWELIASAPVAGVLTFEGGRIVHWREYFDSAAFAAQVLMTSVVWAGGRVLRGGARCAALRRSGDVRAGTASLGQMSASRAEGLTAEPSAL
jgi:hypothetical protein